MHHQRNHSASGTANNRKFPQSPKWDVHIDYVAAGIDEHNHPDFELIGDVKQALLRLTDALATADTEYELAPFRRLRESMRIELAGPFRVVPFMPHLNPVL